MKILVLDNDWQERAAIQQVLQPDGHEVYYAGNSEEAMQFLQEGEIRFVIADRMNTDADQNSFIQRVRDAKPPYHIYILLMSSKTDGSDHDLPQSGADDHLMKPIVPLELKLRIHVGERILDLGDNLVQARQALDSSALFDPLTKVLNRKAFFTLSYGELERSRRAQSPLSLIALAIDNFKSVFDQFGPTIGNDVTTIVAQGIREKSRPYDEVGRYEADTFLIILPGVIAQDAEKIAGRILSGIRNTQVSLLDGTTLQLKVSAGIASSVHITAATQIDHFIEKAIEALQQAKRDGGNLAVTVFV
jgi:two-component system chemotaxis response regulator CheY